MADDDPMSEAELEALLEEAGSRPDNRGGWRKVHQAVGTPLLVALLVGVALIFVSGIVLLLSVVSSLAE